jgi:REP element-mobilizing transposase RayT
MISLSKSILSRYKYHCPTMKNAQLQFWQNPKKSHGGANSEGRRKTARPLATKKPMHFIFRSSRAKGKWSFLNHGDGVKNALEATAKRFHVKVHRFANVGNHIHLLVQAKRREDLQNFLRVFPQAVAFLVTKARKGHTIGKFWDALAFSRIVEWGRDWKTMVDYVSKNFLEAYGTPRKEADAWFARKREVLRGTGLGVWHSI